MSLELEQIEAFQEGNVISLYKKGEGLEPLIEAVREKVDTFEHDLTTAKGRSATASLSAKVSKAKTFLDGLGKKLVESQKKEIALVDASRKSMRDQLDALRDEARAPLTAWENAEKKRLDDLEMAIQEIVTMGKPVDGATAQVYMEIHDKLSEVKIDDRYQERKVEAFSEQQKSLGWLATKITDLNIAEAEKAELEKLRAEKEELDRAKKEEALKLEGEARAKQEADDKIQAEKDRLEAELKVKEEESKAKELEALRAKQDAEKKLAEAETRAQQAEANAVKKAEEAKAQELAEAKKREADETHNKKIKTEAKLAFMQIGLSQEDAVKVVIAICDDRIPHTQIRF
jgi:peptidoglycan DL-endopeptidase RipA